MQHASEARGGGGGDEEDNQSIQYMTLRLRTSSYDNTTQYCAIKSNNT